MAQDRNWTVPVESERPEHWVPDSGQPVAVVEMTDEDVLVQEALNLVWVLKRFGGTVGAVAIREEIAPGIFETRGIAFQWESYAPTKRLPREQRQPQPAQDEPAYTDIARAPVPDPAPVAPDPVAVAAPAVADDDPAWTAPLAPEADDGFGDGHAMTEDEIDRSEGPEPSVDALGMFDPSVPTAA